MPRITYQNEAVNEVETCTPILRASLFRMSQRAYHQVGGQIVTGRSVQLQLKVKSRLHVLHEVTGLAQQGAGQALSDAG